MTMHHGDLRPSRSPAIPRERLTRHRAPGAVTERTPRVCFESEHRRLHALVIREERLEKLAAGLRSLAIVIALGSAAAGVVAFVWTRDFALAVMAASPVVIAIATSGWTYATRAELGRIQLLVEILLRSPDGDFSDSRAAGRRAGALRTPPAPIVNNQGTARPRPRLSSCARVLKFLIR